MQKAYIYDINIFYLMDLYQQEQMGLFTFYKQQEDFEDKIKENLQRQRYDKNAEPPSSGWGREKDKQSGPLKKAGKKCSLPEGLHRSFAVLRKRSENFQLKTEHTEDSYCSSVLPQKKQEPRRTNNKNPQPATSEFLQQNSQQLKNHLQQLLKYDQVLTQTSDQHIIEEKKQYYLPIKPQHQAVNNLNWSDIIPSINLNEHMNLGQAQKKGKTILLHTHKNNRNHFLNLINYKRTELMKKKSAEKFPRIGKKSHSQMLNLNQLQSRLSKKEVHKTRYQNPDRKEEELYLQPVKTERNGQRNPYIINIQCLHPQREFLSSIKDENSKETAFNNEIEQQKAQRDKLLLQLAKKIKFK